MTVEIRHSGETVVVTSSQQTVQVRSPSYDVNVKSGIISGGVRDYEKLLNKPSIEEVELVGDKSFPDLGIFIDPEEEYPSSDGYALTASEINDLWNLAISG